MFSTSRWVIMIDDVRGAEVIQLRGDMARGRSDLHSLQQFTNESFVRVPTFPLLYQRLTDLLSFLLKIITKPLYGRGKDFDLNTDSLLEFSLLFNFFNNFCVKHHSC